MTDSDVESRVDWRRVGLFYGIALGGAVIVAVGIRVAVSAVGGEAAAVIGAAAAALLYMPLPLVAGLVVERVGGRGYLIGREWRSMRAGFWRTYGRNVLIAVGLLLAILVSGLMVAWLAGLIGFPGAGHLVRDDAELHARLTELSPALAAAGPLPSIAVLAGAGILQGLLAGVTVNAFFAFGEEYGWRGVLADELRPLGQVGSCLLTGVLWGFWHAPIIIALGHNYGAEWGWGVFVMVAWTVPFSFLLTWARERTGSVLAPAILHGCFNGVIGLFVYLIIDSNVLIGLPVGLFMGVTLALLALVVWRLRPA